MGIRGGCRGQGNSRPLDDRLCSAGVLRGGLLRGGGFDVDGLGRGGGLGRGCGDMAWLVGWLVGGLLVVVVVGDRVEVVEGVRSG